MSLQQQVQLHGQLQFIHSVTHSQPKDLSSTTSASVTLRPKVPRDCNFTRVQQCSHCCYWMFHNNNTKTYINTLTYAHVCLSYNMFMISYILVLILSVYLFIFIHYFSIQNLSTTLSLACLLRHYFLFKFYLAEIASSDKLTLVPLFIFKFLQCFFPFWCVIKTFILYCIVRALICNTSYVGVNIDNIRSFTNILIIRRIAKISLLLNMTISTEIVYSYM